MIRRFALLLLVPGLALTALGQGISGVTRRTTTLEKQSAARRFLDASGVLMTNGTTTATRPTVSGVARPAMAVRAAPLPRTNHYYYYATRPAVIRTNALPAAVPSSRPARAQLP